MVTFNEYRSKVSILQIAEHLGYLPVKGKSTKARPVLRDAAGDTIIIKHPEMPSMQLYWNLGNSSEHGSVIDFVKNNVNRFSCAGRNEIDNINKILAHFSGIDYDNAKYMNQPVASQKIFNESDYNAVIPDIGMLHFLTGERKISEETIKAFLPFIRIVENNGYKNVGFPFTVADRDDKVRGYELRNYGGFKSFSAGGDKVNAAWIADFSVNRSEINQIFFFESAIDALSFCELKSMSFDLHKSVFVSSGGFPCAEQFRHVMNAYPDTAMLIGCHDNDLHGHLYDITLACVKSNQSFARNKLDDAVEFITADREKFELPNKRINLENFLVKSGIKVDVKAMKPPIGKDWNEMLKNSEVKSEIKKPVFRGK